MNNHKKRGKKTPPGNMAEIAVKNAQLARELQDKYGGAHIRKLSSGVFHGDGTPKSRSPSNGNGEKQIVMLYNITGDPDPEDEKVTKHLYRECFVSFVVPWNAKITKVANKDLSAFWKIRCGDGHIFISAKHFDPKPGDILEGRGEVKVKMVNGDKGVARYPYLNIWEPLGEDELPEYLVEFNSRRRYVPNGSFDLSPASGKKKTILHATKIESWDSHVPPGITIVKK